MIGGMPLEKKRGDSAYQTKRGFGFISIFIFSFFAVRHATAARSRLALRRVGIAMRRDEIRSPRTLNPSVNLSRQ